MCRGGNWQMLSTTTLRGHAESMETVVIIDYGSGNLRSAAKAFERAAHEGNLDRRIVVSDAPDVVAHADRVVLPGVGAFRDCREGLEARSGMIEALEEVVRVKGQPFLGICVGMQLMATRGQEHGMTYGFGWIPGEVVAITPQETALKIPHMGWNELDIHVPGTPFFLALLNPILMPISSIVISSPQKILTMWSPVLSMAARLRLLWGGTT